MRRSVVLIWLGLALAAGGCGEEESSGPTIEGPVAERLAERSETLADTLDAGDVCTAARLADDLSRETTAAIDAGEVPEALRADLMARVTALVNEINCPPPAEDEDKKDDEGKGKKKGKNGNGANGDGGSEPIPTETAPTETVPTESAP